MIVLSFIDLSLKYAYDKVVFDKVALALDGGSFVDFS